MSLTLNFDDARGKLGTLVPEMRDIFSSVAPVVLRDLPALNNSSCQIIVTANPDKQARPVFGFTSMHSDTIKVLVNPEYTGKELSLANEFRLTIPHELHHRARFKGGRRDFEIWGPIVSEGLARQYEQQIDPGNVPIFSHLLNRHTIKDLAEQARATMKKFPSGIDTDEYSRWFYGTRPNELPPEAGYALGFAIVERYLEKTKKTASESVIDTPQVVVRSVLPELLA